MPEVGVHTAEAFQAPSTRAIFLKVRDHDRLVVANYYMRYPPLAVNQETDLAANLKRKPGNCLGKLWRDNKGRCDSAAVEIIQAADLACLQSARMSINLD